MNNSRYQIRFRAFELRDAEFINELRKNNEYESLIVGNKRLVSLDREKKWVEDIATGNDDKRIYFAICERDNDEIIGYTSISEIDHHNKNCFWSGIKLDPKFSGKGYGTQAGLLVLDYVFYQLNMERCYGACLEKHIVAKKMMEKIGYIVEGKKRHAVFKDGKYHNIFILSILKDEFIKEKNKI